MELEELRELEPIPFVCIIDCSLKKQLALTPNEAKRNDNFFNSFNSYLLNKFYLTPNHYLCVVLPDLNVVFILAFLLPIEAQAISIVALCHIRHLEPAD